VVSEYHVEPEPGVVPVATPIHLAERVPYPLNASPYSGFWGCAAPSRAAPALFGV
jgi:hypothetical protein